MTERELQDAVAELAELFNWKFYHTHTSKHSAAGYPDCALVRDGRLVYAELKTQAGVVSAAQAAWLDALARVPGVVAEVWRPEDWHSGHIEGVLR